MVSYGYANDTDRKLMARIVEGAPDARRRSKYPWPEWFDGQTWELKRGEDFVPTAHSFKAAAYQAAKRLGVSVKLTARGDTVYLKADR